MHVGGMGASAELARGVKSVWDAIKKVRAESPEPKTGFPGGVPATGPLDRKTIEGVLGVHGKMSDGVLKVSVGREGEMQAVKVAASMGLTTWVAFSGSDELAAVDGDFIMTAEEVQPVLRALRKANIYVVALHNHMIGEKPVFYFTHFWGKGPAKKLAEGLKDTLRAQEEAHGRGENQH
jgi:hypothetical protein